MEGMNEGERVSLVERKRQEAFAAMLAELEGRLQHDIGSHFESNGRQYEITSVEDCMVAYAQQLLDTVRQLREEVIAKDDYYEEKAIAKLFELFKAYERLVELFAELRSYYPATAAKVTDHLPSLHETLAHGTKLWEQVKGTKE